MREIVLDTETTGLTPEEGHRIVEIGCVELNNLVPTGRTFHRHINPDMKMPTTAVEVHGLTDAFLAGKPKFAEVADEFLAFIGDAPLIIHNAAFDMAFINAELGRIGRPPLPESRAVDTVQLARQKFPGAPANLDALCRRFGIDNAMRTLHGGLLDAGLLAEVYLELMGGRQPLLGLPTNAAGPASMVAPERVVRPPRPHAPTPEELAAHVAFIVTLNDPVWRR
jgi:DNA polymerase-3 subunit epsilon